MNKYETLELVKEKLFAAAETRKSPKYLEIYLNDCCAFVSFETPVRLLCIEFLIRIGDTERAERHISDTDSSDCADELSMLKIMLMNKNGGRREGKELLGQVASDKLNAEAMRLYISALEEYAEFDKAFEILSGRIADFDGDRFLTAMLIRLYDEKIIKSELFGDSKTAERLKEERGRLADSFAAAESDRA